MRSNLLQNVERMWSRGGPPSCFATPLLRTGWRLDCHAGGVKRRTPGEALAVVPRCVTDCRFTKTFQLVLADELVERLDFEGEEIARIRAVAETLGVGFVAPPKREASIGPLRRVDDVVSPGPSRLRPGGTDPPKWIRDQIAALFGRKEP